jgi:hypothetical protein
LSAFLWVSLKVQRWKVEPVANLAANDQEWRHPADGMTTSAAPNCHCEDSEQEDYAIVNDVREANWPVY